MFPTNTSSILSGASLAALCLSAAANASYTTANYVGNSGLEGLGTFTAFVGFTYSSGTTASLTMTLTNTSNAGNGGYLTAVALNAPGASTVTGLNSSSSAAFGYIGPAVSASPYGTFEGGASISSSWLGGGSPVSGVSVGNSVTLDFIITGAAADLAALTASSVLSPDTGYGFVVRFRGFNDGGSDKVLGELVTDGGIPGPGVLAVFAVGSLCRNGRKRRN